ncbi:DUF3604 domain-containing protein [Mesorhizobium qingshengii]|uniref:DUF3604 domain-containing protein n=1 Tax=Mesorhizobium qingshengii TaxID=1165689 RepID=A0A1G5ZDQ9_9HYPH|nr:DUF3604 domain-containing protein [Mesorhizobium qingshengii]SDA92665.1 Protein of unknown function [Mesorhizobium qingshengii]
MRTSLLRGALLGATALGLCHPAFADGDAGQVTKEKIEKVFPSKRPYSPYADRNFPTRPLFGDTHLHTAVSFDAGIFGARLLPRDAYRFAKGEQVTTNTGQQAKLSRPLDFLVVADHSDNMGLFPDLAAGKPNIVADPQGRKWYDMMQEGKGQQAALQVIGAFSDGSFPKALVYEPDTAAFKSTWLDTIQAAEENNDPGRFTAFIGYEWTAQGSFNIHRNIIFKDGGELARQSLPFTTGAPLGSPRETDLWKWMANYESKTGGDVLAIAHNGNVSNGLMFPFIQPFTDKPVDQEYAEARHRWEPVYEVTQMKGDGEAHPFLSPNDEFANFEKWDKGNLDMSEAKKPEMLEHEYARSGLKLGLKMEKQFGVNPFKFGMIGSTDAHTGLPAVEEDNFWGKVAPMEPSAERLTNTFVKNAKTGITVNDRDVVAAGYAAVWATENTRQSIFDAMERREVYATTGTRMAVRLFGGYEFTEADAKSRNPAVAGYGKGVPMGGDLGAPPEGKVPTFLIAALKDPIGANLDRYQIIKGWLDEKGETHEKVYDVVWSGDRKRGADGKVPAVGNTVDVANATWTNSIGSPELIAAWKDPEFDPKQSAFYYGRVLEIPTPRWTTYDAKYYGLPVPTDVPSSIQERAYTSPIWYTPAKS